MRLYTIRLIATLALAILVAPLAAAAQQATKAYRIGRLQSSSPSDPNPTLEAFREGLRDLGYIEGQNLVIESRYAEGREERLPDLAAELVRLQVEVMIAKGEYLGIYEEKKLTFRQFAPGYLVYSQAHKALRSFGRDQGIIETRRMSIFRDQYLSEITRALAKQYKAQRLEVVDPATVNKELNCLKASLNRAVAWKHLKTNRLGGIKLFKEPPGRLRYLSLEEKDRLLEACTEPLYLRPIIELAIHTDMRRGEILGLSWRDIDGRRRTITLHQTKNNEWRVIPINQTVAAIVKTLPRHLESDALFPGVNGNMVTMAFRRACWQARIPDCRFLDLRHTFGSHLAMEGFNLRTIQQLLGHKDLRMTMRYAHLSAEHFRQAVNRFDAVMRGRLNGPHHSSRYRVRWG